jgi:ABC-type lipoprotein release transport system permease subunit
MNTRVLRAAIYRFRATFPRRWGEYVALAVLLAVLGGAAMGSIAAARRTQASFPVYLASTHPSTVTVFSGFGLEAGVVRKISHLPHVEHAATLLGFDGDIDLSALNFHLVGGETPPAFVGSTNGEYATQDRVTLVDGKLANPHSAGQAVMNARAAQELRANIGTVLHIGFYSNAEGNSPVIYRYADVKITGLVVLNDQVVEDDYDSLDSGTVVFSPALTRQLAQCCVYYSFSYLALRGDNLVPTVLREVDHAFPDSSAVSQSTTAATEEKAQRAIKPESIALGVFGAIAALAALVTCSQVIGRQLRRDADELGTLRALGAEPLMTMSSSLVGIIGAVVLGAGSAVVVAVGLSPLSPLGPVRSVYPSHGISFDWTVLGYGALTLILGLSLVATIGAYRNAPHVVARIQVRRVGESRPRRSTSFSRLPVSAGTGLRFALEPGVGRSTVPVRSAIFGTALALVIVVGTLTFGSSLDTLVSHPGLYGWNWTYEMLSGFAGDEDLPLPQVSALLNADHYVSSWSGVYFLGIELDGQTVPALAASPGAAVAPPVLSGHGLESADQVVLGVTTLRALHKRVGDTVLMTTGFTKPKRLVVVGTVTMPAAGSTGGSHLEMGTGAVVSHTLFPPAALNSQGNPIPGPNAIFVRVRPGTDPGSARRSLDVIDAKLNAIPNDGGPAGGVVSVLRPAEIVNYRSISSIPVIVAGAVATGAIVALALTLIASVRRRRRDLALLKTLGFTHRQLAATIAWQSTAAVAIGIAVGLPLGIVLGRILWDLFAHQVNAVPVPNVPTGSVVLVSVAALALANVIAALPGRVAARTQTAVLLRAE